ncbi:tetratricopeptide repeat protein [Polynucleobacter sp. AP-Jannik-300A-C4]|uniref:tetratricopeptide repeat protein n=1 Tax=Polynucleobacter sp. AP-Jannik-300A-C4 TaxID=2576928 RepID=UPI001BFD74C1|nr:tetratricopeptide repeat protein [Polynucleobacter sp. AP-Jannik-300A-C4]QWE23052.1 tetratricopeptide repeat protein [Polynucleobacter sp. AP-Jannik-300A-C4]
MNQSIEQKLNELIHNGLNHQKSGDLAKASNIYQEILRICPNHFDALHLQGVIHSQNKEFELAVKLLRKAKKLNPKYAAVHNNLGIALQNLNSPLEAANNFKLAISLDPNYASAYFNLGNALQDLKRFPQSIDAYNKCIDLDPQNVHAYYNKAHALYLTGKFDSAIEGYNNALCWDPQFALALNNRGLAKAALYKYAEAIDDYNSAITLDPKAALFYNNKGSALSKYGEKEDALNCFRRAIELDGDFIDPICNYADLLRELKRYDEAKNAYEYALAKNPNLDYLLGMLLHVKMIAWDWGNFDQLLSEVLEGVKKNKKVSLPFPLIGIQNEPKIEQKCARIYAQDKNLISVEKIKFKGNEVSRKIKIGYFSADFHNHPVAHLISGMFEFHDKSQFEIIGFSHGPIINDESRVRIDNSLDKVINTLDLSDDEVVNLCRHMEIDIAIDLGGYTAGARFEIFSKRCAPIQINYLGFPGTMANTAYDYIIADEFLIPEDARSFYTEKIIYLPSYQVNDSTKKIADSIPARKEFGLEEGKFVFACFNNSYKINPRVMKCWMNILNATPNSILWLANNFSAANDRLLAEFSKYGVDKKRIVFAQRLPEMKDHLARLKLADLFLDTFFYNAHTTASDALWSGLPVVTLAGRTFSSRVAGSILKSLNTPELIAYSEDEYERIAINLANNRDKLDLVRENIAKNRLTSKLFDTESYTRSIERGYSEVVTMWRKGISPANLFIY